MRSSKSVMSKMHEQYQVYYKQGCFLIRFWYNIHMGVYTCRKCGKSYEADGLTEGFCHDCLQDHLDKYHQVREYLWEHPGSTAAIVAKECDCSVRQVMQWVKEDRFMLTDGSRVLLFCANCGAKITSGVYCTACQAEMAKEKAAALKYSKFKQRAESMYGVALNRQAPEDESMRFLHTRNNKNK